MSNSTAINQTGVNPPNAKTRYEITRSDLPVHCPISGSSLWNSHPRVFIALNDKGHGKCPYCGAEYQLKK